MEHSDVNLLRGLGNTWVRPITFARQPKIVYVYVSYEVADYCQKCMQLVCNLHGYFIGNRGCDVCIFDNSDYLGIIVTAVGAIGTCCSGYFPVNSVHSLFDYALEVPGGAVRK